MVVVFSFRVYPQRHGLLFSVFCPLHRFAPVVTWVLLAAFLFVRARRWFPWVGPPHAPSTNSKLFVKNRLFFFLICRFSSLVVAFFPKGVKLLFLMEGAIFPCVCRSVPPETFFFF